MGEPSEFQERPIWKDDSASSGSMGLSVNFTYYFLTGNCKDNLVYLYEQEGD